MGIRVFISSNSGNQKIENEQQKILMVLKTRRKEFEVIDIMAPGNQNHRTFMREKGKKKEGQRNVIPPQIFNGDDYRGDFDDFDLSNEDNMLEEFLGIERENPKMEPVKTGAMAPEVKKLTVGKLDKDRIPVIDSKKEERKSHIVPESKTAQFQEILLVTIEVLPPLEKPCPVPAPSVTTPPIPEVVTSEENSSLVSPNCYEEGKGGEETDSGIEMEESEVEDIGKLEKSLEGDGSGNGDFEESLSKQSMDNDISDEETDSDDFTDSEDDTVEYMPDGELVRKCKRGFKQLNNCKRFWKVTNIV